LRLVSPCSIDKIPNWVEDGTIFAELGIPHTITATSDSESESQRSPIIFVLQVEFALNVAPFRTLLLVPIFISIKQVIFRILDI
jgi:hypothetical protein